MPDGLATGILAGVNPLSGLYAYMVGTVAGALFTLSVLSGAAMIIAGLFFAAAPVSERALPSVTTGSRRSVVILRLRGRSDLGSTFMDVLVHDAAALDQVGSRLVVVSANERIQEQLAVTGVTDLIGAASVYPGDERVGATLLRAYRDAEAWVAARPDQQPDTPG